MSYTLSPLREMMVLMACYFHSIAGGETVNTFLSAVTYYLLATPGTYDKLRDEIRGRYKSYDEIDATTAQQLPYLTAVINEGLRIYPPGAQGFPRVSPGAVVDGHYVAVNVCLLGCSDMRLQFA